MCELYQKYKNLRYRVRKYSKYEQKYSKRSIQCEFNLVALKETWLAPSNSHRIITFNNYSSDRVYSTKGYGILIADYKFAIQLILCIIDEFHFKNFVFLYIIYIIFMISSCTTVNCVVETFYDLLVTEDLQHQLLKLVIPSRQTISLKQNWSCHIKFPQTKF